MQSCIAALKQKNVNLEVVLISQLGETVFRLFPCCCDEILACFFTTELSE